MIYNDDSLTIMVFHGRPTRPTRAVPSAAMMKQGEAVAFYLLRPVLLRRGNVMLTRNPGTIIPCLVFLLQYVYSYSSGSRVLLSSCVSEYYCCSPSQLRERNGVCQQGCRSCQPCHFCPLSEAVSDDTTNSRHIEE
jgi:hypothetical protein